MRLFSRLPALLLLLAAPLGTASAVSAQSLPPAAYETARAQEVLRLSMTRDALLASNRRYAVPAIGLGLGVATLVTGGVVFAAAWGGSYSCVHTTSGTSCTDSGGYNATMDRAGLVMMPLGAAMILVSTPMLVVRLVRHRRLKRAERSLEWLGRQTSLAPLLDRRHAGLMVTARF